MNYRVRIVITATKPDGTIIDDESSFEEKIATQEQAMNYLQYNKMLKRSLTTATFRDNMLVEIHGSYIAKCYKHGQLIKETLHQRDYYLIEEKWND